ncbi:hypothetical protein [Paenibacillus whitsoniae]|uniref:Uncharacterized protein n=1 Tax=Paenibacillus whitsoniae TaxID=2496558 RepID=A0A430JC79_9BACL|nr:hypothetical protein [Paenibacillus whitsoniae]RTE08652.1 hypothetical protein EJQ19_16345 [Paenibacillus whitsoniae]
MQEMDKKQITPVELAAGMMQATMRSIENGWDTLKPVLTAYLSEPVLTEAKEDELIREIYLAALALEIYCIPTAFETNIAQQVSKGMGTVMASEALSAHQLSEPIRLHYLPQFEAVNEEGADPADMALRLVHEAVRILYDRLALPLKPADPVNSLLWAKLFPFVVSIVGKWPIFAAKFEVAESGQEQERQ